MTVCKKGHCLTFRASTSATHLRNSFLSASSFFVTDSICDVVALRTDKQKNITTSRIDKVGRRIPDTDDVHILAIYFD